MLYKGLVVLAAMVGLVQDDWTQSPGSLMVTSASIFKVNKAQKVSPEELVAHFENAFFSMHKSSLYPEKKFFILRGEQHLPLTAAEGKPGVSATDLVIDQEKFLELLRKSGLQLETAGKRQFSSGEFKQVQELIDTAADKSKGLRSWLLLSRSALKDAPATPAPQPKVEGDATAAAPVAINGAPAVDQSLIIEWGNTEAVKAALDALKGTGGEDKAGYSEQKIYEKHFEKLPLRAKIFLSKGNVLNAKPQEVEAPLDGMFVVRSKFDKGAGYLLFLSGEDRRPKDATRDSRQKLVAIEANFNSERGSATFQVDAECFLNNVVYTASGKNFTLPAIGKTPPESTQKLLVVEGDAEKGNARWNLKVTLPTTPAVASAASVSAPAVRERDKNATPVVSSANERLEVDLKNAPTDSYSIQFNLGEDVTPPVTDATPIVIYDKACKPVVTVDSLKPAATTAASTRKPEALP